MSHSKRNLTIPILSFFLLWSASLLGQTTEANPILPVAAEESFKLTIENDLLSLKAQEAPLTAILAEIGHKMHIEIVGEIPSQETITAEFHNLGLEQALHSLSSNYGYQTKTDEGQQKIAKIFVLPQGMEITQAAAGFPPPGFQEPEESAEAEVHQEQEGDPERPQPFKFEFDPSALMGK